MTHIESIVELSACVDVNNGSEHIHGLMREFMNKKGQKEKIFVSFFQEIRITFHHNILSLILVYRK
jgi:hypothetical protein